MSLVLQWRLDPALPVALAAAVAYVVAARRVGGWPVLRTAAWMAGLVAVAAALASGIDADADRRLSVHMVQHVLLTLVAPPLLLAGAPVRLALRSGDRRTRRAISRVLRGRVLGAVTHPVVAWSLYAGVMLAFHLTGAYDAALRHDAVHALEHAAFFWTAVLFWLPLAGAAPVPHRLGVVGGLAYLMTAMGAMAVVGAALSAPAVRYPEYLAPAQALGISALADQHAAGAIMLACGGLATVAATFGIVWPALLREERHAQARERLEAMRGDVETA